MAGSGRCCETATPNRAEARLPAFGRRWGGYPATAGKASKTKKGPLRGAFSVSLARPERWRPRSATGRPAGAVADALRCRESATSNLAGARLSNSRPSGSSGALNFFQTLSVQQDIWPALTVRCAESRQVTPSADSTLRWRPTCMSASDPERPVARNDADARAPRWRPANGLFIARLPNRLGFRQRQTTVESFRRSLSPAQRHGDCDECHAERNHRQPGPQRRRPGGRRHQAPEVVQQRHSCCVGNS